jgi:hypothetical protein
VDAGGPDSPDVAPDAPIIDTGTGALDATYDVSPPFLDVVLRDTADAPADAADAADAPATPDAPPDVPAGGEAGGMDA